MAKYFCPKCKTLTFALRYQTGQKWYKIGKQYCKICKKILKANDCLKGTKGLEKLKGR